MVSKNDRERRGADSAHIWNWLVISPELLIWVNSLGRAMNLVTVPTDARQRFVDAVRKRLDEV
jgi:hypothetical protein